VFQPLARPPLGDPARKGVGLRGGMTLGDISPEVPREKHA